MYGFRHFGPILALIGLCVAQCALYGTCGRRSIFGASLPCANITSEVIPAPETASLLLEICGKDFPVDKVCCSSEQVKTLQASLKRADPLISSCPACKKNFYRFFCEFLCLANLAAFLNVTKTAIASDTGHEIVTEVSQYVNSTYAEKFYDLCKGVKFLATNGFAMDLLGGSATNFQQFLKFLGDEKPLLGGLPFQINFKYDKDALEDGFVARTGDMRPCSDPEFRCACSDCDLLCPTLPKFNGYSEKCTVGGLACFTGGLWLILFLIVVIGGLFHVWIFWKGGKFSRRNGQNNYRNVETSTETSQEPTDDSRNNFASSTPEPSDRNSPKSKSRDSTPSDVSSGTTQTPESQWIHSDVTQSSGEHYTFSIDHFLSSLAFKCAKSPIKALVISIATAAALCSGLLKLDLETDPVKLWVSPHEQALLEKNYYETAFGEFYRVQQLIISSTSAQPALLWESIQWWFSREAELANLGSVRLDDVCFKPLGDACIVESFTQYFQGDISQLSPATWSGKIQQCAASPVNCLPVFQQPLKPAVLFSNLTSPVDSEAFVVTLLLNSNSSDTNMTALALQYEQNLRKWIQQLQPEAYHYGLHIDFSTESSLEEELSHSAKADVAVVAISYACMFIYALVALSGRLPLLFQGSRAFVTTRFLLGLGSIALILVSVVTAAGICSLLGVKSTLIVAEVIPFLILAVGIDNVFLITEELSRLSVDGAETALSLIPDRISLAIKRVGPSCFASAALQLAMFLLAALVEMPAVRNFAIYLAVAVFVNFVLQMTAFVALLSLDQARMELGYMDGLPWIHVGTIALGTVEPLSLRTILTNWVSQNLAPFVLARRRKIVGFFGVVFLVCLSAVPYLEFGLDQRLALPSDSYLVLYFSAVYEYLNVGPPVYFVVKDADITGREAQQRICGKFSACNEQSLNNLLTQEFKRSNISTINEPVSSWLDDFLTWLDPALDQCCRLRKTTLGLKNPEFCTPYAPDRQCQACYADSSPPYDSSMEGFPQGNDFMFYFEDWIRQPSDVCPLGGRAPYSASISQNSAGEIVASNFRTSHTPMKSQQDFIIAYKNLRRIVQEIQEATDLEVFAYLPFYVFFVQYVGLRQLTAGLLSMALVVIFLLSVVLLTSVESALKIVFTVGMVIVDMLGVMVFWGVSLNAVSLVNLVISVGIAVEFTIHITRAFATSKGSKLERSTLALEGVGGSVLGGITFTKLIGVAVLAFARSKIFEVYYFRMWASLVVIAAAHGLCFLPVLLSF